MTILYTSTRSKRSKSKGMTKAQLKLAAEWEALKAKHARPLEKGAKANGLKVTLKERVVPEVHKTKVSRPTLPGADLKTGTTIPIYDPLKDAKRALRGRVGASYNKGGLQYLTDDELREQREGTHKRR